MARSGMANLIQRVRVIANVGTAEWTQVETYWSDDHIESELDAHRQDLVESIAPLSINVDGAAEYHDYYLTHGDIEEASSGTAAWQVRTTDGALQGTANYSVNYRRGLINFPADTGGSHMLVRYRTYDLYATAANIWEARAGNVAAYYNIKEGEHSLSRTQWFEHCMAMASQMRRKGKGRVVRMVRSDING